MTLVDFSGVFPRPTDTVVETSVVEEGSAEPILKRAFKELPSSGMLCAPFSLSELKQGNYMVRATLIASNGLNVTGEQKFQYPPNDLDVPSPSKRKAAALQEPPKPPLYSVELQPGGGFIITVSGRRFPVESSFSYPQGGENRLSASKGDEQNEPDWRVTTKRLGKDRYEIAAKGSFYTIQRLLRLYPNRVSVQDTIRNDTNEDLGVILDNYLDAAGQAYSETTVAGYPGGVERKESQSPSSFVSWKDFGIGLLPLDDVCIVHSTVYAKDNRAGIKDDKFGLAAGASCTLEWAVYPTASPDYYDFLNAVRRDEGRNSVTVDGGFAFVPREPFTKEYAETRNLLYGSFGCLAKVADDPEIEIEGIDFLWLPRERARIKAEFEAIHKINPHLKLMFHVAHNLISTNKPETLFPDSRVMNANGKQVLYAYDYDACAYFSPQRHKEGWRWYIYYPMPGNSFHDALIKSVDVMVDDIGCGGAFMDGFFYGYGSPYTYERWDGHTVEMDPETKTIKRKVGSVLLLMQPSMVEFTKKMVAKGGVVIANNVIQTRTISSLPMIVDQECRPGPRCPSRADSLRARQPDHHQERSRPLQGRARQAEVRQPLFLLWRAQPDLSLATSADVSYHHRGDSRWNHQREGTNHHHDRWRIWMAEQPRPAFLLSLQSCRCSYSRRVRDNGGPRGRADTSEVGAERERGPQEDTGDLVERQSRESRVREI